MQFIKLFICIFIFCILLDMTWLALIAKNLYQQDMGLLLRKVNGVFTPNYYTAILVYVAIACGIIFFVLPKTDGDYSLALLWGGVFGLIVYGVFDLTNFSILANFPLRITLIDMLWGILLCSLGSVIGVFAL